MNVKKPSRCAVGEDAPSGITAAVSAGMRALEYAADSDEDPMSLASWPVVTPGFALTSASACSRLARAAGPGDRQVAPGIDAKALRESQQREQARLYSRPRSSRPGHAACRRALSCS